MNFFFYLPLKYFIFLFLSSEEKMMEENPFPGTVIADWSFLDNAPRTPCPKCQKSRKYYCYNCYIALPCIASLLPKVKVC